MEPTSTGSIRLARGGLAAVFAWNVIRAVTQSVTPGEAWNYDRYIGPRWTEALAKYDSNNHVLNTILVRISTARIHLTELTLRLPSLLFGAFYLCAVYRLAKRVFGDGNLFLAVVGLLTLNPLVMDAMSEARGYGMALAAWMWALELVLESLESFSMRKLNLAGVLLGVSVAASLAFLAPATALILVALAWRRAGLAHLPHLAIITAFVLLVVPLNHAEQEVVTKGATSLRQTLKLLTEGSFGTSSTIFAALLRILVAILSAAAVWIGLQIRWRGEQSKVALLTWTSGGSLVLSLLLMLATHAKADAAFPEGGAIYLVPLITLSVAGMAARSGTESAQITFLVFASLCVAHYADHLQMPYRAAGDLAGGRELAKSLRADAHQRGVKVAVSDDAEGILRYYRWRYRQANWERIERPQPDASYDYYVLTARDAGVVDRRGLHVLYRDAGLILAK